MRSGRQEEDSTKSHGPPALATADQATRQIARTVIVWGQTPLAATLQTGVVNAKTTVEAKGAHRAA